MSNKIPAWQRQRKLMWRKQRLKWLRWYKSCWKCARSKCVERDVFDYAIARYLLNVVSDGELEDGELITVKLFS